MVSDDTIISGVYLKIPLYLPLTKGDGRVSPFEKGGLRGIPLMRFFINRMSKRGLAPLNKIIPPSLY
jgi:hypothetical protein